MDTKDRSQLGQALHSRRDAIADSWYQAVARTGYVPLKATEIRQRLVELTEQAIELLVTDPFEPDRARAIGAGLARLHYIQPDALSQTQEILARQFVAGLPAEQVAVLQPRLTALIGELAVGFFRQAREALLVEQEQIRGALVNTLRSTEKALREAHSQLEVRVEERTAELAKTNEELRVEIVERKRAEDEIRQRTAQLEALRAVGLELTAQLNLDALLHSIVQHAIDLLDGALGGLYLYQPERDVLELSVSVGRSLAPIGSILHRGEGLCGRVWEAGEPLIVDDYRHWEGRVPTYDYEDYPFTAVVAVPIHWGADDAAGEFLGILDVLAEPPRTFSSNDTQLLTLFATQAAIAIKNARLYEQIQQDAETKATLLREVNHRVRNNLAAIVGLLNLEKRHIEVNNPVTYQIVMEDLTSRVQGLVTVHCLLSAAEWSPLLLSELAEQMIDSALQALPLDKHVSVEVSSSPVRVASRHANSLALVINELTTNSAKYAWPARQTGRIRVRIDLQEDGMVLFEFRDDGVGYPEEMLHLECHGIGWTLIKGFVVRSLRGEMVLHNDQGAVTTIRFPVPI